MTSHGLVDHARMTNATPDGRMGIAEGSPYQLMRMDQVNLKLITDRLQNVIRVNKRMLKNIDRLRPLKPCHSLCSLRASEQTKSG